VDEVDEVQNNEVAFLLVNQMLPHNGNVGDIDTLDTNKEIWINISKVLSMVHEIPL
jgi:hypothetical protein